MGTPTYEFVEAQFRQKTFGVFSTIDSKGRPHSTGVLFGVAPPSAPLALYILTLEHYVKVRNVRANPASTLVVPFPHRILSLIPAPCVTFRCRSEVIPHDDPDGRWAYGQHRILRDMLAWLSESDPVFLKLTPEPRLLCHGVGIPLLQMRRDHTAGDYRVTVPERRRPSSP